MATMRKYEYDLGMATNCYQCGDSLKEGQDVHVDDDKELYCSETCLYISEGGYDAQQS